MSSRELKRLGVLARVEKEALNLIHAAESLDLSYRQAKRLRRRYREEGAKGLQHRKTITTSSRAGRHWMRPSVWRRSG